MHMPESYLNQLSAAMLGQSQQGYTPDYIPYYPPVNSPPAMTNCEFLGSQDATVGSRSTKEKPKEKPLSPFKQLSNHDFHKLLDEFDKLLLLERSAQIT